MLSTDSPLYTVTKSWWLTSLIGAVVLVADHTAVRRIPPRKGLRQVILYDGELLLTYADDPPVAVPWDAIESTAVDHGAVETTGNLKVEKRGGSRPSP